MANPRKPNAVLALLHAARQRIIERETAKYAKDQRVKIEKQARRGGNGTRGERRG